MHLLVIDKQLTMPIKTWKTIVQQRKKVLTVFDDMTANIKARLNPIVNEMLLKGKKHFFCFCITVLFQST